MNYSIRNILVPVDLSENSLNALDTAVALAKKHQSVIYILNVIENNLKISPVFYGLSSKTSGLHTYDVISALAGAIEHASDIEPVVIQEEGNVIDMIINTAFYFKADLVVMGTHGASGYRDGFIGSTAYSVIKNSLCPVLTIPPRKKYTQFRKSIFPIRPMNGALQQYDVASKFLSANSSMKVLGLSNNAENETSLLDKIITDIKERLQKDEVKFTAGWGRGQNMADDVLTDIIQHNHDLIILTSLLDVTVKPFFIGPYAQKIINCAKVPILNIKKISISAFA